MNEVRMQLMTKYRFSAEAVDLCIQAQFRCAYCDHDLLELFEDFRFSQTDHLLPKSKYPGFTDVASNHVLSCQTCNILKRNWDPNQNEDGSLLIPKDATSLSDTQRSELIVRAKRRVQSIRDAKSREFDEFRRLLRHLSPSDPDRP